MCKMNEKGMMFWGRRRPEKIVKGVYREKCNGKSTNEKSKVTCGCKHVMVQLTTLYASMERKRIQNCIFMKVLS